MVLTEKIEQVIFQLFGSRKAAFYMQRWQTNEYNVSKNRKVKNFEIIYDDENNAELSYTLSNINDETLIKIAIDLDIDTPGFIPSIPTFKNEIKENYTNANTVFKKAIKQIEEHPDIAIGLANSALESIIKEILNNKYFENKQEMKNKTLYKLTATILKEFSLFPNNTMPKEIKTIGSSLIAINQSIEKLRSEKSNLHGKISDDYIIDESIYAYFIINSITTVGMFLISFYKEKFNHQFLNSENIDEDEIPF